MKEKFLSVKNKIVLGVPVVMALSPLMAHAEGSDIATVTNGVTEALSGAKGDFMTALGTVVGIGVGFFLAKYVVLQVINYFKKVASK